MEPLKTIKLTTAQKIIMLEVLKAGAINEQQSEQLMPLIFTDPFKQMRLNHNLEPNK